MLAANGLSAATGSRVVCEAPVEEANALGLWSGWEVLLVEVNGVLMPENMSKALGSAVF